MSCNDTVTTTFPLPAGTYTVYGGDDWRSPQFSVEDANGTPVNLSEWTGWRGTWEPNVELGIDTSKLAEGKFRLALTGDDTRLGRGDFDVEAEHPDLGRRTWIRGTLRRREDITK